MTKISDHTAILVFIRTDEQEARAKAFRPNIGRKGNRKIAQKLNRNIVRAARKTQLPTFIISGDRQIGHSFGERLADGFQKIFNRGFDKVIAVGNDCLSVSKSLLLNAHAKLADNEVVIGPAEDGGAYLIGLSKKAFRSSDFIELGWESPRLFRDLSNYSHAFYFKTAVLKTAPDIDSPEDFQSALNSLSPASFLKKQLENLLKSFNPTYPSFCQICFSLFNKNNLPARAPPFHFSS